MNTDKDANAGGEIIPIVDGPGEPAPGYCPDPWRILVVDDDADVHVATRIALDGLSILGRPLLLAHASSAREARELLAIDRDFAVVLLDVVMETADAGLLLVEHIRRSLQMAECRIVLRTGHPGSAPAQEVFDRYEINDYQTKSELGRSRLVGVLNSALRAYEQIHALAENRRELAEARNALAEILDNSPVPTFVLDHEQRISHWNRACEAIIGRTAAEMNGTRQQWAAFYAEERPVLADLVMRSDHPGIEALYPGKVRASPVVPGAIEAEDFFPILNRWLFFTAAAMHDRDGRVVGAIETLQDVTARKEAEMALVEAKAVAESAARVKAEFLANMSHEIRTPLNAILGLAHLVLKSELDPRQHELLLRLRSAGEMLLELINDILDFTKIESNRLVIEHHPFVLDELLDGVSTLVSERAREKGLELHFVVGNDVPQHLVGDELRLKQVLVNLVNNAIKFTEQGQVLVSVWLAERSGERVRLEIAVQDTGIGISPLQQAKLFRAFAQADTSTTRKYGGTGLGLTISKRLVELMGGRISLGSEVGEGSIFLFDVQLAAGAALPESAVATGDSAALVVDDNDTARGVLSRLLARHGYRVDAVAGGEAALARLAASDAAPYRLLFVDWHMPGVDGVELLRRLPAHWRDRLRVVVITAAARPDAEAAFAGLAYADLLQKPFSATDLSALLAGLEARPLTAPLAPVDEPRLNGLRVLVVDDVAINRMIIAEILADEGVAIDEAENGREAVERVLAGGSAFDVVLMDVQMPEMNGMDATRRIHAEPRFAKLPIIAVTAFALEEERRHCLDAGMNGFLTKPIDPELLVGTLRACVPVAGVQAVPASVPPPAGAAVAFPPLPGIDTEEGLRRMMNKPAFYEKMLKTFHDRYAAAPAVIDAHLAAGGNDDARREAHSVKGVAASIGAGALRDAALALEKALAAAQPDVSAEIAVFAERLAEVIGGLRAHFGWRDPA